MRKLRWNIFLTIMFICVFIYGIRFVEDGGESADIEEYLTFIITDSENLDNTMSVKCWKQNEDKYLVFFPSYANLRKTVIHLDSPKQIFIGDIELSEGRNCDFLELEKEYSIRVDEESEKTIQFIQSAEVPCMDIVTSHSNLDKINNDKDLKESVSICVRNCDGKIDYYSHLFDDQIRGRGNSTWGLYEKKPYNIYLNREASLLDMNSSKEWVMLANASDATNLRNKIVYDFIKDIKRDDIISPECEYVDLYVDGEYLGLYLLCEKLQSIIESSSVNDGILFCMNNARSKMNYPETAIEFKDLFFEVVDSEEYTEETNRQFEDFLREADEKLYGDEWSEYIDKKSFAVKYLIEEIFSNIDAKNASQYYYWNQEKNCLFCGPYWDYDLTFGDLTFIQWIHPDNLFVHDGLWYNQVFTHDEFNDFYKAIYRDEFMPIINEYLEHKITETYNIIEKASENNFIRWSETYRNDNCSPRELLDYLSEHAEFLNSIWLRNERYYRVDFRCDGALPIISLYLPEGTSAKQIPTPKVLGLEENHIWHDEDTGMELDDEYLISDDLSLYIDTDVQAASEGTPKRPDYKVILAILTIVLLFASFVVLLCIDYRNTDWRGKASL